MLMCDRHPERRAAHTICLGVSVTYDICAACADEIKNWVAEPGEELYAVRKSDTDGIVAQKTDIREMTDGLQEQEGQRQEGLLKTRRGNRRKG